MSLLERLWRAIRANVNSMIAETEDPERILEQIVYEMQQNLICLRQAVAMAIANQKRTERQFTQNKEAQEQWLARAQLALEKGDEQLARIALERRQTYYNNGSTLAKQLEEQSSIINQLKSDLRTLEAKINEVKIKKDLYIARIRAAETTSKIQELALNLNKGGGANKAFERLEAKLIELEAQSEVMGKLGIDNLESKFATLEGNKLQKLRQSPAHGETLTSESALQKAAIDLEIEKLRAELDSI